MSKVTEDWCSPGTRQTERATPVLDPAECKLDGRTLEDHFKLTQRLSEHIPFPEESTTLSKDKRWVELFKILNDDGELNENLAALANQQSFPPHLALFVTFLTLYEDSQQQLNDLVPAHLDYYYRRVLGLTNKPLESDRVHAIIKLAKNISEYPVAAASLLDGGEDADGNPIHYRTERDIIVNHAQIATVKSLHVQFFPPNRAEIRINDVGESIDDNGIQFDDNSPAWPPFGLNPDDERLQALHTQAASLGFAIASPSLALKEGIRLLTIAMEFDPATFGFDSTMDKPGTFQVYLTGEKGWTGPHMTSVSLQGDSIIIFRIFLNASDPAVGPFQQIIHGAEIDMNTAYPVLRCMLNTGNNPFHNYEAMRQWQLRNITLRVEVSGVQELIASNDFGPVDTSKAFHPFGPLPNNGGTFSFGIEELAMKPLESVKLHMNWIDAPEDLAVYYLGYGANLRNLDTKSFTALGEIRIGSQWEKFTPLPLRLFAELQTTTINGTHRQIRGEVPHSIELTKKNGLLFEAAFRSEREVVARTPEVFRLTLDGPNVPGKLNAFGHKEFPLLKTASLEQKLDIDALKPIAASLVQWSASLRVTFDQNKKIRSEIEKIVIWTGENAKQALEILLESIDFKHTNYNEPIVLIERSLRAANVGATTLSALTTKNLTIVKGFAAKIEGMAPSIVRAAAQNEIIRMSHQLIQVTANLEAVIAIAPSKSANAIEVNIRDRFPQFRTDARNEKDGGNEKSAIQQMEAMKSDLETFAESLQSQSNIVIDEIATTLQTMEGVRDSIQRLAAEPFLGPNEPYTPTARLTGVDYVTVDEWSLAGTGRSLRFFHVEPFGVRELSGISEGRASFVPSIENEGYLYIGIRNLNVPGSISILFQVDEARADPDAQPSEGIQWHYLSDGEWLPFKETTIEDDTDALLRSGIIVFSIPEEASLTHQRMPSGLHWIRGSVINNAGGVAWIKGLHAQAVAAVLDVSATFDNAHLKGGLPPDSITRLQPSPLEVRELVQPYPSFGGREQETPSAFRTRVSERLRHKNRAITPRDIEYLVLEVFPDVAFVRCLSHTSLNPALDEEIQRTMPGHFTVIIVGQTQHPNQLVPRFSAARLTEIMNYLRTRTSPFITLVVRNPEVISISLHFEVAFQGTGSFEFFRNQLSTDLRGYLSPWTKAQGNVPSLSGQVYRSSAEAFVTSLSYVDHVEGFGFANAPPELEKIDILPYAISIPGDHEIEQVNASNREIS